RTLMIPTPSPRHIPLLHYVRLYAYLHHPHLHSFPTRRSSDLTDEIALDFSHHLKRHPVILLGIRARFGLVVAQVNCDDEPETRSDRKSTRLNSSHEWISYAVFCLKKKKKRTHTKYSATQIETA